MKSKLNLTNREESREEIEIKTLIMNICLSNKEKR